MAEAGYYWKRRGESAAAELLAASASDEVVEIMGANVMQVLGAQAFVRSFLPPEDPRIANLVKPSTDPRSAHRRK